MRDIAVSLDARRAAAQGGAPFPIAPEPPRPAIETRLGPALRGAALLPADLAFLPRYGFSPEALIPIARRAEALGVPAVTTLLAAGDVTESAFVRLFAHHFGARSGLELVPDNRVQLRSALAQGWFRGQTEAGETVLAVDVTGAAARALMTGSMRPHRANLVFFGRNQFNDLLRRHFSGQIALDASQSVPIAESARFGMNHRQIAASVVIATVIGALLLAFPEGTAVLLPLLLGLFFLGSALSQLAATVRGMAREQTPLAEDDTRLPNYSVLVPLYREARVVPDLVKALNALDYPAERLQVLLVVEEHDHETIEAIEAAKLPPFMTMFRAPAGAPHTKPRAINAAMPFVTGDFVVVYDAEDHPEPGQLRAAIARFAGLPGSVACLQARLCIDNTQDSWITRFFTIEYAALFDVVKAGTARLGLPVPLGGTSNHFRTATLRAIGLWDAWNVTEDADLGLRLAIHGLGVEDLDSTTYEEAPHGLAAWMHQRSRWLKGWMQTIISHSRTPLRTWRAMGTIAFLSAIAQSAGVIIGAMGAPVFHAMVIFRILAPEPMFSGPPLYRFADGLIIVLGIAGILAVYVPALLAIYKRRFWPLLPLVPLLPLYQLLVSVAAYKAFWELIRAPHRWNKTQHGVHRTVRRRPSMMGTD